jgi:hypothetical protein
MSVITQPNVNGDPGFTSSQVSSVQALVSDAGNSRRFQGTRTVPISTFNGASSSGVVGIPTSLRIPANTIVYGQSRTQLEFVLRKVGASTGFIATHFGPNNSAVDTSVAPATGNAFTATDPQEFEFRLIFSYSVGRVYVRLTRYFTAAGFATDGADTAVAFDPAVDNFVNVVLSGMSAGTTVALTSLAFDHFR